MKKKWTIFLIIVFIILLLAGGVWRHIFFNASNGHAVFRDNDTTISQSHREDFSVDIEKAIAKELDNSELKKVYMLRANAWFLSDQLTEFSQVATTDVIYVIQDTEAQEHTYSVYEVDENGELEWQYSGNPNKDTEIPSGFAGLTYSEIESALSDYEYEDYIITYSNSLMTVFVWARGQAGDVVVTYPTRPEFVGLEKGAVYTLDELKSALSDAYSKSVVACGTDDVPSIEPSKEDVTLEENLQQELSEKTATEEMNPDILPQGPTSIEISFDINPQQQAYLFETIDSMQEIYTVLQVDKWKETECEWEIAGSGYINVFKNEERYIIEILAIDEETVLYKVTNELKKATSDATKYYSGATSSYSDLIEQLQELCTWPNAYESHIYLANLDNTDDFERICIVNKSQDNSYYHVYVENSEYEEIWSQDFGTVHVGEGAVFLCTLNGKEYLLEYSPWVGQGMAAYHYFLIDFQDDKPHIVKEKEISFELYTQDNVEERIAFMDEVNALIEQSQVIMSTLGMKAVVGLAGAEEFKMTEEQLYNVTQSSEPTNFSFEGTTFRYEEDNYDVTSRVGAINSILSAIPVGEKIVIECHVGPRNGVYFIFDTVSKSFEPELKGNHLIWCDDDITTAIYSFWSDVFTYDGKVIKSYDLAENEFIYNLTFSDDNTKLSVTIMCDDGTEQIDIIDLQVD